MNFGRRSYLLDSLPRVTGRCGVCGRFTKRHPCVLMGLNGSVLVGECCAVRFSAGAPRLDAVGTLVVP